MNQVDGRGRRGIFQQILECGVCVIGSIERDQGVSALEFNQITALVFCAQLIEQRERVFVPLLVLVDREQHYAGVVGRGGLFFDDTLQARNAALFVPASADDGRQRLVHEWETADDVVVHSQREVGVVVVRIELDRLLVGVHAA